MTLCKMLKQIAQQYPDSQAIPTATSTTTSRILTRSKAKETVEGAISAAFIPRKFDVSSGAGIGRAAYCPWIGIFDPKVCWKPPDDAYNVAYIFGWPRNAQRTKSKLDRIYLCLLMGTSVRNYTSLAKELQRRAKAVLRMDANTLYCSRFASRMRMSLNASRSATARKFEHAFAIGIQYKIANLCNEPLLTKDLQMMLWLYTKLVDGNARWW